MLKKPAPLSVVGAYTSNWALYETPAFDLRSVPYDKITHLFFAFWMLSPSQFNYNCVYRGNYNSPNGDASDPRPRTEANRPLYPPPVYDPTAPEGSLLAHDEYADGQIFPILESIKRKYPHLKILLSLGGWSLSWNFSHISRDPALRANMVTSCARFLEQYPFFDGFDIDNEYVGKHAMLISTDCNPDYADFKPGDGAFFAEWMGEMRAMLDSLGREYLLTSAAGVAPENIAAYAGTAASFNFINLMTYDMSFYSSTSQGHQAPLRNNPAISNTCADMPANWNVQSAVELFMRPVADGGAGFDAEQMVIGIPAYGRTMTIPNPADPDVPIYQAGCDTTGVELVWHARENIRFFRDLEVLERGGVWDKRYDEIADAAVLRNPQTGEVASYDDQRAADAKASYVRENGLGGIFTWRIEDCNRQTFDPLIAASLVMAGGSCPADTTVTPDGKTVTWSETRADTTATGRCGSSTAVTAPTRHCNAGGTWDEPVGECREPDCAAFDDGDASWPAALADPNTRVYGTCGYNRTGEPYRYCKGPNNWGPVHDPCESAWNVCPTGVVDNANWPQFWPHAAVEHVVDGECMPGFETVSGPPTRICTAAGWTTITNRCLPGDQSDWCPAENWLGSAQPAAPPGAVQTTTCAADGKTAVRYCDSTGTWQETCDLCADDSQRRAVTACGGNRVAGSFRGWLIGICLLIAVVGVVLVIQRHALRPMAWRSSVLDGNEGNGGMTRNGAKIEM